MLEASCFGLRLAAPFLYLCLKNTSSFPHHKLFPYSEQAFPPGGCTSWSPGVLQCKFGAIYTPVW